MGQMIRSFTFGDLEAIPPTGRNRSRPERNIRYKDPPNYIFNLMAASFTLLAWSLQQIPQIALKNKLV